MTFSEARTGVIDWLIDHLKNNLVYIVVLVMGYVIYQKELERRTQTFETLQAVRDDRNRWAALALKCHGIDTNKIAILHGK